MALTYNMRALAAIDNDYVFWSSDIYNIYIASGSSVPLTDAEVQALMKQIDDYHGLGVIP